jgi:putative SOS response-associated peptidase YedK
MCGRFTQHHSVADIETRFDVQQTLFTASPHYNIAPTQTVSVIVTVSSNQERYLEGFQWGLIPHWAKDTTIASKLINARAETVSEKPAFRESLKYYRCLIPADGFYEWDKEGGTKQPYYFRLQNQELFGFAGLYSRWRTPSGDDLYSCTIITTAANDLVGKIHDRMPMILETREQEKLWLNNAMTDSVQFQSLLKPYPAVLMEAFPVDKRVGSPANDDPELLTQVHL